MFVQFHQEEGSVYINVDKIVSIYEDKDNKIMITTINPNEFYTINEPIVKVLEKLRYRGIKVY